MYRLKQDIQLESMYPMHIYKLAMMRADISHYRIETDELRAILSCEDKYARFADFKWRTLEMARSEINEKTDISFEYKIERKGRTLPTSTSTSRTRRRRNTGKCARPFERATQTLRAPARRPLQDLVRLLPVPDPFPTSTYENSWSMSFRRMTWKT
jgi:hypothetical protein